MAEEQSDEADRIRMTEERVLVFAVEANVPKRSEGHRPKSKDRIRNDKEGFLGYEIAYVPEWNGVIPNAVRKYGM